MTFRFEWNPYADQPHNVAPRKERLSHHLRHAGSYFSLTSANLRRGVSILRRYRRHWKNIYGTPVSLGSPFAVSVSPAGERNEEVIEHLKATGARQTLVRIPSWEKENLARYESFLKRLREEQFDVTLALLQRRDDIVLFPSWVKFLEEVFSRFATFSSSVEVGHAWNRTKWGVWDYTEFLDLALPAVDLAKKYGVKLVGPAVIDFEFHLYPPTLQALLFDKVSSLLYVDRKGAPENKQYGWDTSRKIALLRAVVDASAGSERDIWITEINWPLQGTGKFSPASGRPNVTEGEQADYLVRYFVLCLATGFVYHNQYLDYRSRYRNLPPDAAPLEFCSLYDKADMKSHLSSGFFYAAAGMYALNILDYFFFLPHPGVSLKVDPVPQNGQKINLSLSCSF